MLPFSRTFSGDPAISVPSEYDNNGLPSDSILYGKQYDVEKLIKTSFHLEKIFERQKPQLLNFTNTHICRIIYESYMQHINPVRPNLIYKSKKILSNNSFQISKIIGCSLKRIGELPNAFTYGSCETFLFDGDEMLQVTSKQFKSNGSN